MAPRLAVPEGMRLAGRIVFDQRPHRVWHFQGVPARELADRAGHSKPSMSLDIYSHVIVPDEVDPEC